GSRPALGPEVLAGPARCAASPARRRQPGCDPVSSPTLLNQELFAALKWHRDIWERTEESGWCPGTLKG
ncbi:hypothetical protein Nmel_008229, partial [Mimus melanotis]